jgi:hypothetical protein
MAKITRYEFMGSWVLFWAMCVSVIGLPVAVLYLVNATVRIEHELDDPERFVSEFRAGRWGAR